MTMNQEQLDKHIDKLIKQTENEAEKILARRLKYIKQAMAEMLDKYQADDPHVTWTEFNKYDRFKKELKRIEELLQGDYSDIINLILLSQTTIYLNNYMRSLYMYEYTSGIQMTFTVPSARQIANALAQPIDLIKLAPTFARHRKQVIEKLRGHIAQGVLAGNSYNQIANAINKDVGLSMRQARMVARTETGRSQSVSSEDAAQTAKDNGARLVGYWDSTLDTRTRPSHRRLDGKQEDEAGNFKIGASYGPAPRLLVGVDSAIQNINCRCKKLYKVNNQMPEVRRTKDGLIKYMNYDEWVSQHET